MLIRMCRLIRDEDGQVLLFGAITALLLVCFVAAAVNVGILVTGKIKVQNGVDSAALGAGIWQARALNMVQRLNIAHYNINMVCANAVRGYQVAGHWACHCDYPKCKAACRTLCRAMIRLTQMTIDRVQQPAYEKINSVQKTLAENQLIPYECISEANNLAEQNGVKDDLSTVVSNVNSSTNYGADTVLQGYASMIGGASTMGGGKVWGFLTSPNEITDIQKIYATGLTKDDPKNGNSKADWLYDLTDNSTLRHWLTRHVYRGQSDPPWNDITYYHESGKGNRPPITFLAGQDTAEAFLGGLLAWSGDLTSSGTSSGTFQITPMLCLSTVQTRWDSDKGEGCDIGKYGTSPNKASFDSRLTYVRLPGNKKGTDAGVYH